VVNNHPCSASSVTTVEAYQGEQVVVPQMLVGGTTSYWRLRNIVADGNVANGSTLMGVGLKISGGSNHIEAYGVEARNFHVTTDSESASPQGFLMGTGSTDSIQFINDSAHNNGTNPCTNQSHGFYIGYGTHIALENVLAYDNCAYQFHLYPDARHVLLTNFVAYGSDIRSGIVVASDQAGNLAEADITVRNGIVQGNSEFGLHDSYSACPDIATGSVEHVLGWQNPSGDLETPVCGLVYASNLHGNALFQNPLTGDFHLLPGSPGLGVGDPNYTPAFDFAGNQRSHADLGAYAGP
jgi:hypothetical protein